MQEHLKNHIDPEFSEENLTFIPLRLISLALAVKNGGKIASKNYKNGARLQFFCYKNVLRKFCKVQVMFSVGVSFLISSQNVPFKSLLSV